jgi:hypothetical protein
MGAQPRACFFLMRSSPRRGGRGGDRPAARCARRGVVRRPARVRSHCRFRNRGTEYVSKSGMPVWSGWAIDVQSDNGTEPYAPPGPRLCMHRDPTFRTASLRSADAGQGAAARLSGDMATAATAAGTCARAPAGCRRRSCRSGPAAGRARGLSPPHAQPLAY